ncbi:MAG: T9SS type A sorting domain-containing protein [Saprospiraceae bacterium]|nr:T9SS type A sorting domain-containing protein [Saprospiraceae bacterium]
MKPNNLMWMLKKITHLKKIIAAILFICCLSFSSKACDEIILSLETVEKGDTIELYVRAIGYKNVVGFQFSLNFSNNIIMFLDVVPNKNMPKLSKIHFNTQNINNGYISCTYVSSSFGDSFSDNDYIYYLKLLKTGNEIPKFYISDNPVQIEFLNHKGEMCVESDDFLVPKNGATLKGKLFVDNNQNCQLDTLETSYSRQLLKVKSTTKAKEYFSYSRNDGSFSFKLPVDEYTLDYYPVNNLWTPCQSIPIKVDSITQIIEQNLLAKPVFLCTDLGVSISNSLLRRCFNNTYYIDYYNNGTITANNIQLKIILDPHFELISSSLSGYTIQEDTLIYNINELKAGDKETFQLIFKLSCDSTVIGQTHCLKATITDGTNCYPSYSGPSIKVGGKCLNDKVVFEITNTGAAMTSPSNYIIVEDDVIMKAKTPIKLGSGVTESIELPANGKTYRIIADQVKPFPFQSHPTVAIEGCSSNSTFSKGFVTKFEEDDRPPFIDIDCKESVGSYDPNDKSAIPTGTSSKHYISENSYIEYMIRFQNTGTDTAFTVKIFDQLSDNLDITTLEPMGSSHPYRLEIAADGKLLFRFSDINLVDSFANEALSHGFVKYKIKVKDGVSLESKILNSASIFFDYNEPVLTNTVTHTIGNEFVINAIELVSEDNIKLFPNPASQYISFTLNTNGNYKFVLYDAQGKLQSVVNFNNPDNKILINHPTGNYFYQLLENSKIVNAGKLIISH